MKCEDLPPFFVLNKSKGYIFLDETKIFACLVGNKTAAWGVNSAYSLSMFDNSHWKLSWWAKPQPSATLDVSLISAYFLYFKPAPWWQYAIIVRLIRGHPMEPEREGRRGPYAQVLPHLTVPHHFFCWRCPILSAASQLACHPVPMMMWAIEFKEIWVIERVGMASDRHRWLQWLL